MVLKLKDLCLDYISEEFDTIGHELQLLDVSSRESVLDRLVNHDLLELPEHRLQKIRVKDKDHLVKINAEYQNKLVQCFFNGNLNSLRFNYSHQVTDKLLHLVTHVNQSNKIPVKLSFKSLFITSCAYLSDEGLSSFVQQFGPNIEKLCLNHLHVPFKSTLGQSIRSGDLVLVDLSYCSMITDEDLWPLCKNNPYIKSLKLTHCGQITNEGVRNSLHMLQRLECLDIEGIRQGGTGFFMSDDESHLHLNTRMSSINFKHMKRLTFSGSNELDNSWSMRKMFSNSPNLVELNILYSSNVKTPLFLNLFNFNLISSPMNNPSPLRHLPLSISVLSLYRPNIKDSNLLVECLSKLINLKQLSLYCVECLDDKSLITLIENIGSQLTLLNLGGYMALPNRLGDESVKHIAKQCSNLTSICFNLFSATATLSSFATLLDSPQSASRFEAISLSACRSIAPSLLSRLALNCSSMKRLDLSGLNELVSDSLIKNAALTMRQLESLDIKGCKNVTDESVCLLALNCSQLRVLVLSGICLLTDKCVFAMADHLHSTLQEVYISGCSKITRTALRYLSDKCINKLVYEHKNPNLDPNTIMAKNLDTGNFERVDLCSFRSFW